MESDDLNQSEDEMATIEDNEEIENRDNEYEIFRSFINEEELTACIKSRDILGGLCHYVENSKKRWKERSVNIAIAGNSGTGKSSLINALRGMRPYETGAAKVGVTETTTKAVSYSFPTNDRIRIFDLPGMGTITFPVKTYMEVMEVSKYDALIIVTSGRITENDVWFTKEIMTKNKHVLFVRTKIDMDIMNEKTDKPKSFVEKKCLARIKNEIITTFRNVLGPGKLRGIYLLSSRDKDRYDFPKLTVALKHMLKISGRAIRKMLGEYVQLFIDEKRVLNKGEFLGRKVAAFLFGLFPGESYNMSRQLREVRHICLRKFCLDDRSLEQVSLETGISVDDLKARLKSFRHDEEESGIRFVMRSVRYYHTVQHNLAKMCDNMASDEMDLVNLKLDRVEVELSPL